MSRRNSDALRQRWGDAAYRERQTEVIRRAAKLPRVLSKRKKAMNDDAIKDARIVELEVECERLREKERQSEAEIVTLSLALIDMENWIVAAEPLVPFGMPASFGQWRRPAG